MRCIHCENLDKDSLNCKVDQCEFVDSEIYNNAKYRYEAMIRNQVTQNDMSHMDCCELCGNLMNEMLREQTYSLSMCKKLNSYIHELIYKIFPDDGSYE